MTGRLLQKAAIITGAARGIGYATARLFAREGASLGLMDRDPATLTSAVKELATEIPGAAIYWRQADISDHAASAAAMDQLVAELGKLDILVNNAAERAFGPVADATPKGWAKVLEVNVTGFAMCSRAALPHLRKSGHGSIVNVSSVFAIAGRGNMGLYDASKAAALALTRVLACEEARHGIRVNAVCPSSTWTPWTYGRAEARGMSLEELKAKGAMPCLLGRWAEADDVAFPILWLASSEASFITGVALPVDGGLTAM
jgi:meso-butanediol dehydrogenase/(S,S)-butanediol dehydrogenase/diacetyl reductase